MKRFISILVAVMMVLTLLPLGRVFAEEEVTEKEVMAEPGEDGDGTPEPGEGGDESGSTELDKAKETAKTQIDSLEYLSDSERNSFKTEIDNANSDDEISTILEKAKSKNTENKAAKDAKEAEEKAKLEEAKTKAKNDINALKNLSQEEKDGFIKRVNEAEETTDITAILAEAENEDNENKAKKTFNKELIKSFSVTSNPTKMSYKEGEALDLTGLKVKLVDSNNNEKEIEKSELAEYSITVTPDEGTKLTVEDHNDVEISIQKSGTTLEAKAGKLIVTKKEDKPPVVDELAKAKENAEKEIKALTKLTDEEKAPFLKQVEEAKTVKDVEKALKNAKDANAKKTTPSVPSDNYSTRVPRAIRTTIANANAMMADPRYGYASYSSRANLEDRLASLKSIANDFENGYYSRYWNGKYWNGYYGDEWYDYYENGYYYRNGAPYTYSGFRAHFGYYPKYDMSDYYGRGYWNGKYRRGYYRDGWYDYYENGYYYRDGVPYTYNEFRREFGYYPDYAYGRGHWYDYYDEDWDPYYGYQGRYGYYYGSSIRDAVERTVDAINAVAISADAPLMKVSYPSSSDYDGYYDYYPWYYDPYYYDGYYYDQNSSKIRELKKLIGEAEELAASRSDAQWAPYRSELTDAANYGRKAAKGRASVKGAIEELEKAIKKAKTDGMKLYIRRGYMTGVNGTEFNPSGTLTRAEMAQIIENLLEQSGDTVAFAPKNFNDVESGRWYKKAVNLVSSHNIMKGNPDGNFYPQKPVSIEELIVIAARLGGHTPQNGNVFGIEKHYWSVHYIQTAYVKGWIGMDKFNPSAPITRGQAVQILNRSLNFGVDKEFINKYGAQMNKFSDVTMSSPYYYDIVAATNTISYSQVPKSRTRIWRAYQTSNGWSSSKYSNGTYVKPYTGW